MSASEDRHLQSLFAQPAELPESEHLLRRIAADIERAERRMRWRRRVLGGFALAGLALPVIALTVLVSSMDAGLHGLLSGVLDSVRDLRPSASPGARSLWGITAIAAAGLLATGFAASLQQRRR